MLKQRDGIPVFRVSAPRTGLKLKRVDISYTNDGDVKKRVWTTVTPERGPGETWSVPTPVSDHEQPLFAFANFIYEIAPLDLPGSRINGRTDMAVTSNYVYAWPKALKAAGVKECLALE